MSKIAGTGAHLNAAELRVWTSLLDASRIVDSELEAQLQRDHDLTHREYEVLVRLDGSGGRMRMSALARQIEASGALITQTVVKLEERGLIVREASDVDRRGVDAVLTKRGRASLQAASGPHASLIRALLLEPMGPSLDTVADALGTAADHLRAHRRGESCGDPSCPLTLA